MKKTIKFLSVFLVFFLAFTAKTYGASDFTYTLNSSGKAVITAYNGTESNLTIPSTIDNHEVYAIGSHAFDESRNATNGHTIKNIVISEGIERIELLAFAKCTNLETVKLPESLTFIDMQAFLQCTKLKSINIPSKITKIGDSTFQETGLTEFDIPENVKSIDSRALGICSGLKKVRVYSNDIVYAQGVFEYGNPDLVLYGYEGSTTQTYAQQNGIKFELLAQNNETPGIKLFKNELALKEGEVAIMTVQFIKIPTTKIIWTSNDENVVTVDEVGRITATGIGNAVITVSTEDGQYKDTCTVSVTQKDESVLLTTISLNKNELTLYVGETEKLTATVITNNEADRNVVWKSSDTDVATVENGKIVAKAAGEAIITVSNKDGTVKDTCNVTVKSKEEPSESNPDNTMANKDFPNTGINMIAIVPMIFIITICVYVYKKYNNYKEIK